ncbi:MAG: DUF4129 domain-containing protein [Paracoccaceae bacterium]
MNGKLFQLRVFKGFALGVALALSPAALAEITEDDLEAVGPRNQPYLDAIWGSGIQSEVVYIRPSTTFTADERVKVQVPERQEEQVDNSSTVRFVLGLILAAILAAIAYVIFVNANGVGVSFRDTMDTRRRSASRSDDGPEEDFSDQPLDQFLVGLAAMADKREALILLVSRALEWSADLHQVRLGRSQTARDVLRILPREWTHMQTMRGLVREAEIVHFGGRDISEERWQECLTAARPIFHRGGA